MTNREWLNTLSDEDYAEEWLKIEKMLHGDCGFHIEVIMEWLSKPHSTTADEDFAEIGFKESGKEKYGHIQYIDKHLRVVNIFQDKETVYWTNTYLMDSRGWTDELIDAVRPITDKKRKEVWE